MADQPRCLLSDICPAPRGSLLARDEFAAWLPHCAFSLPAPNTPVYRCRTFQPSHRSPAENRDIHMLTKTGDHYMILPYLHKIQTIIQRTLQGQLSAEEAAREGATRRRSEIVRKPAEVSGTAIEGGRTMQRDATSIAHRVLKQEFKELHLTPESNRSSSSIPFYSPSGQEPSYGVRGDGLGAKTFKAEVAGSGADDGRRRPEACRSMSPGGLLESVVNAEGTNDSCATAGPDPRRRPLTVRSESTRVEPAAPERSNPPHPSNV
ncbi:hypothetical protein Bbelb_013480 [Branchiostoma belcheri]|nr:hypothetical protein Bbelb_013480 [Branchiostoma belcheri]